MARYYDERHTRGGNGAAWAMVVVMALVAAAFLAFLYPNIAHMPGLPEQTRKDAVGNQAPPERRGSFGGADTYQPADLPAVNAGIDAYNATSQAQYDQAVQARPIEPTLMPLPLNSVGNPVISEEQQRQQAVSLQLAEQEGAAAADAQMAAQRATADAANLARPPDVSKADAEQMMHRDLCSVPRANPATCGQGLYKPTPVN